MSASTRTRPAAPAAPRHKNATASPNLSAIYPASVVPSDAPMPTATPTTLCVKLKCPLPRVVSATTSGTSTPRVAAENPSSSCTAIRIAGSLDQANTALRTQSGIKQIVRRGRRPQLWAERPTQGAMTDTTSCGPRMQAAITAVAQSGECAVNELAIIGSMAAFESWKSTTTAAKTNSGQLWKTLANPSDQAAASRLGTPPRASLGVDICRSDMCQGGERRNAE